MSSVIASPTFAGFKAEQLISESLHPGYYVFGGLIVVAILVVVVHASKAGPPGPAPDEIAQPPPPAIPIPIPIQIYMPKQEPPRVKVVQTKFSPPPSTPDPPERLPNPEPYDEPRWPRHLLHGTGGYRGDLGSFDHGQYGAGGRYAPGMLADRILGTGFPFGSPEDRILKRPRYAVGPWVRVGHLLRTSSTEVLPLFARNVSRHNERFDYRVLAGSDGKVPVEVATFTERLQDDATIALNSLGGGNFVVHLNQYVI